MNANPALRRLGFSDSDRVVIFHTDDIGMCQAAVSAYQDLIEFGLISSAAVMTPCAWFPQVAAYCRQHPNVDIGVHLTLTSEWNAYRWGPISTRDNASGMIDEEGYFFRSSEEIQQYGDVSAVHRELEAQIERTLASGISPTHIDTHMGSVLHSKYLPAYFDLARKYKLPCMILRRAGRDWWTRAWDDETFKFVTNTVAEMEDQGFSFMDNIVDMPLDEVPDRVEHAIEELKKLPAGITHFLLHPSLGTPELQAIAPDWRSRVSDYETFRSEKLRQYVKNCGIQVIGYRALRDLIQH
jgi:predicted glycoside hydrolase/deacetylase ChbG (UPF0249 family)